tara:strand:- start:2746 stop:2925 length:180 start_codon:yes stop_codon:yes gene_type:complete
MNIIDQWGDIERLDRHSATSIFGAMRNCWKNSVKVDHWSRLKANAMMAGGIGLKAFLAR